jgi:hypothetical protein
MENMIAVSFVLRTDVFLDSVYSFHFNNSSIRIFKIKFGISRFQTFNHPIMQAFILQHFKQSIIHTVINIINITIRSHVGSSISG